MGYPVSNFGALVSSVGLQVSFTFFFSSFFLGIRVNLEESVRKLVEDRGEVRANVQN